MKIFNKIKDICKAGWILGSFTIQTIWYTVTGQFK